MERPIIKKDKCMLCNNQASPLFMFPKDCKRLNIWLKAIGKDDLFQIPTMTHTYIYNNARLCTQHFKDSAFTSSLKTKLIRFAVPYYTENRDVTSPTESLDCSSENTSDLAEPDCGSVLKDHFPSIQIDKNSTFVSSSANKVSEKESLLLDMPPSKNDATSLEDSTVTIITLCCTDRKEGIAFHKFLQDPEQRTRWVSAVKSKNSKPTHISVLCPRHFNEERPNDHPSALKENTAPNVYALDLLSKTKDTACLQKWKGATPVDDGEIPINEGSFQLHHNPKTIDKIYVKVMWDESVMKIAKRMHSSQAEAVAGGVDMNKKLKKDKACLASDLNNLSDVPDCSVQKDGRVSSDELGEKMKKDSMCGSSDASSDLPTLKHLLLTPTEKLVKHVVANTNSQKDTVDSPDDPNFSDTLYMPMHSPQTGDEEPIKHVDVRENLKNDAVCSSNNLSNELKHLLQKSTVGLDNNTIASKDLQKDTIYLSGDDSLGDPLELPMHVEKTANHVKMRENVIKDTICLSSDSSSNLPNLPVHLPQTDGEEVINHDSVRDNLNEGSICSSTDINGNIHSNVPLRLSMKTKQKLVLHARKKLKKLTVCSGNTKNRKLIHFSNKFGVRKMIQNSAPVYGNKEKMDPVSSPSGNERNYCTIGTITEKRDLNDSFTQTDVAEVIDKNDFINHITEDRIDSNNSQFREQIDERTNAVNFPTIVSVKGGIDPCNLLEISEIRKHIKTPNEWWTVSCTPKYVICLKLNEDYDSVFRVVIEKDYNVKIFIKSRECVNRKISLENISALLQEVDSYEICAGISDKSMSNCVGHLENGSEGPFSIWCKGCQRKGDELMNRYKLLQELQ